MNYILKKIFHQKYLFRHSTSTSRFQLQNLIQYKMNSTFVSSDTNIVFWKWPHYHPLTEHGTQQTPSTNDQSTLLVTTADRTPLQGTPLNWQKYHALGHQWTHLCHTSKCSHDYCTWSVKLLCHIPTALHTPIL